MAATYDVVMDLWWMEGLWTKVGLMAKRQRQQAGEPRLYENFEALVAG